MTHCFSVVTTKGRIIFYTDSIGNEMENVNIYDYVKNKISLANLRTTETKFFEEYINKFINVHGNNIIYKRNGNDITYQYCKNNMIFSIYKN
jgi:hypothetical protein